MSSVLYVKYKNPSAFAFSLYRDAIDCDVGGIVFFSVNKNIAAEVLSSDVSDDCIICHAQIVWDKKLILVYIWNLEPAALSRNIQVRVGYLFFIFSCSALLCSKGLSFK